MTKQLNRVQLRKLLIREAAAALDPQGIQSMRAQRSFLHDNFEDDVAVYKDRIKVAAETMSQYADLKLVLPLLKCEHLDTGHISELIVSAELDHGMSGIIDHVLGVDV